MHLPNFISFDNVTVRAKVGTVGPTSSYYTTANHLLSRSKEYILSLLSYTHKTRKDVPGASKFFSLNLEPKISAF